jgi:hypothetical protein
VQPSRHPMTTKKLDHPAFGPCELVPTLIAVKWKAPLATKGATSALSAYSLKLATQIPKVCPARKGHATRDLLTSIIPKSFLGPLGQNSPIAR